METGYMVSSWSKSRIDPAKGVEAFVKLRLTRDLVLERLDELFKDSELTEGKCIELGRMVKNGRFERLKQLGLV